ncbi:LLM class flavin-dependent oxidoreductase, partial [Actinomadura sp. 7K534]|uniref:LLM class flavin-dependent oxidoreductase n=1 Tax=Actinomadura sp. 7K534 TaxID=2530366 RepID=UPI00104C0B1A
MRLGIFLLATRFPCQNDTDALSRTVEAAVAAERAGFDDVWLAEHHFMSYGVVPSATLMAGHLLAVTRRIHVGTAVSVLSAQHPVALAEQAAMLSLLSGGRFRLGVGRGGPWRDLEVFGTGLPRYEHGFAESLDLLLAWLRSDRVSWQGEHFRFREVPVVPRALAPLPVTVACTSPATEALAAERGLPMLLGMHVGPEEKAAAVARHGLPDLPHISTHVAQVADTREEAAGTLMAEMPRWLGPGLDGYVPVDDRPRP